MINSSWKLKSWPESTSMVITIFWQFDKNRLTTKGVTPVRQHPTCIKLLKIGLKYRRSCVHRIWPELQRAVTLVESALSGSKKYNQSNGDSNIPNIWWNRLKTEGGVVGTRFDQTKAERLQSWPNKIWSTSNDYYNILKVRGKSVKNWRSGCSNKIRLFTDKGSLLWQKGSVYVPLYNMIRVFK